MSPVQEQVLDAINDKERLAWQGGIVVEQMMTATPTCIMPDTPAPEIIKLIYTKPFHHLLVIDAEEALAGVISDRDVIRCFCRNATGRGSSIAGMKAADIMSTDLETVAPDTPIREAVNLMRDRGISSLPVMAGTRLVGILTDSDLWTLLDSLLEMIEARQDEPQS
jgi:acetoin utilization protein AcuB